MRRLKVYLTAVVATGFFVVIVALERDPTPWFLAAAAGVLVWQAA